MHIAHIFFLHMNCPMPILVLFPLLSHGYLYNFSISILTCLVKTFESPRCGAFLVFCSLCHLASPNLHAPPLPSRGAGDS